MQSNKNTQKTAIKDTLIQKVIENRPHKVSGPILDTIFKFQLKVKKALHFKNKVIRDM